METGVMQGLGFLLLPKGLGYRLGSAPHPGIVTIRDDGDHIRVLCYSNSTTTTGWGVHLRYRFGSVIRYRFWSITLGSWGCGGVRSIL